jgi:hypothetical protein
MEDIPKAKIATLLEGAADVPGVASALEALREDPRATLDVGPVPAANLLYIYRARLVNLAAKRVAVEGGEGLLAGLEGLVGEGIQLTWTADPMRIYVLFATAHMSKLVGCLAVPHAQPAQAWPYHKLAWDPWRDD